MYIKRECKKRSKIQKPNPNPKYNTIQRKKTKTNQIQTKANTNKPTNKMSYLYPSSLGGAALETTPTAMSLTNLDEITIENTIRSYQHRLAEYAAQGCHYSLQDVSNIDLFPPDNSSDTESSEDKRDTFKLNMDFVQGVLRIQLEIQESRVKLRHLQEQETNLRKIVAEHDTLISDLCRVYHSFQATAHVRLTESLDTSLQPLHHAKQLAEYELLACVQRIQYVQEWIATLHGSLCTVTDCHSPMGRGLVKNTTTTTNRHRQQQQHHHCKTYPRITWRLILFSGTLLAPFAAIEPSMCA